MKIVLNNEEKEILTNILLEELNRIRKYEYLIFTDKEKFTKYQNTVFKLHQKLINIGE